MYHNAGKFVVCIKRLGEKDSDDGKEKKRTLLKFLSLSSRWKQKRQEKTMRWVKFRRGEVRYIACSWLASILRDCLCILAHVT